MVQLSKVLRFGNEPNPYFGGKAFKYMVGIKEPFIRGSHHFCLLPIHIVTIVGCTFCAFYMARCISQSPDVTLLRVRKSYPWMAKGENHQYLFFSGGVDYKTLENPKVVPEGFHHNISVTAKQAKAILTGGEEHAEEH